MPELFPKTPIPRRWELGLKDSLDNLVEGMPRLITGDGVLLKKVSDRFVVELPTGDYVYQSQQLQYFVVMEEFENYLICVAFYFTNQTQLYDSTLAVNLQKFGLTGVPMVVAKPQWLQQSWLDGQTVLLDGTLVTLTFPGIGQRTYTAEGQDPQDQSITASYFAGDIITAKSGATGLMFADEHDVMSPIVWQDMNTAARSWSIPPVPLPVWGYEELSTFDIEYSDGILDRNFQLGLGLKWVADGDFPDGESSGGVSGWGIASDFESALGHFPPLAPEYWSINFGPAPGWMPFAGIFFNNVNDYSYPNGTLGILTQDTSMSFQRSFNGTNDAIMLTTGGDFSPNIVLGGIVLSSVSTTTTQAFFPPIPGATVTVHVEDVTGLVVNDKLQIVFYDGTTHDSMFFYGTVDSIGGHDFVFKLSSIQKYLRGTGNISGHVPAGASVNVITVTELPLVWNPVVINWNIAVPANYQEGIDRCAALLKTLNGGVGP